MYLCYSLLFMSFIFRKSHYTTVRMSQKTILESTGTTTYRYAVFLYFDEPLARNPRK
jgi:hypothetical protein